MIPTFVVLQAAALWPAWLWAFRRAADSPEAVSALLALLGAAMVLGREIRALRPDAAPQGAAAFPLLPLLPIPPLAAYVLLHDHLPPLIRTLLALLSLAAWLPRFGLPTRSTFHALGFLILSLPILPTMQFYLGYPLRALAGGIASRLLNLAGYPVLREGALLSWRDQAVLVDAPCSGVKMIGAGLLLALALAAKRRADLKSTASLLAFALAAVVLGNALRATGLFFLETGILRGPALAASHAHEAVGLAAFLAMGGLILAFDGRSRG